MDYMILAFILIVSLVAGFVLNLLRQKFERVIHEKDLTKAEALMLPAKEIRRIISESNDYVEIKQLKKSLLFRKLQYVSYFVFVLSMVVYAVIKVV